MASGVINDLPLVKHTSHRKVILLYQPFDRVQLQYTSEDANHKQQKIISCFTQYSRMIHLHGFGLMAAFFPSLRGTLEDNWLFDPASSPAEIPGRFPTRVCQDQYDTNLDHAG